MKILGTQAAIQESRVETWLSPDCTPCTDRTMQQSLGANVITIYAQKTALSTLISLLVEALVKCRLRVREEKDMAKWWPGQHLGAKHVELESFPWGSLTVLI